MTFAKAIEVTIEIEEASKVAKEMIYNDTNSSTSEQIVNCGKKKREETLPRIHNHNSTQKTHHRPCYRCGKTHLANDCRHQKAACNFCSALGHLGAE